MGHKALESRLASPRGDWVTRNAWDDPRRDRKPGSLVLNEQRTSLREHPWDGLVNPVAGGQGTGTVGPFGHPCSRRRGSSNLSHTTACPLGPPAFPQAARDTASGCSSMYRVTSACAKIPDVSWPSAHQWTQISSARKQQVLHLPPSSSSCLLQVRVQGSLQTLRVERQWKKHPAALIPYFHLYLENSKPVFNPFGRSW